MEEPAYRSANNPFEHRTESAILIGPPTSLKEERDRRLKAVKTKSAERPSSSVWADDEAQRQRERIELELQATMASSQRTLIYTGPIINIAAPTGHPPQLKLKFKVPSTGVPFTFPLEGPIKYSRFKVSDAFLEEVTSMPHATSVLDIACSTSADQDISDAQDLCGPAKRGGEAHPAFWLRGIPPRQ